MTRIIAFCLALAGCMSTAEQDQWSRQPPSQWGLSRPVTAERCVAWQDGTEVGEEWPAKGAKCLLWVGP